MRRDVTRRAVFRAARNLNPKHPGVETLTFSAQGGHHMWWLPPEFAGKIISEDPNHANRLLRTRLFLGTPVVYLLEGKNYSSFLVQAAFNLTHEQPRSNNSYIRKRPFSVLHPDLLTSRRWKPFHLPVVDRSFAPRAVMGIKAHPGTGEHHLVSIVYSLSGREVPDGKINTPLSAFVAHQKQRALTTPLASEVILSSGTRDGLFLMEGQITFPCKNAPLPPKMKPRLSVFQRHSIQG